ncbi:MAG: hypothetical protein QOE05_678 [Actinomycetota bacterium]|jgi:hypothetical protein|nr:hypothetical protein [Actinomycetota bacterium]
MVPVRWLAATGVVLLVAACSTDADSEPPPTSAQASPSPSEAAADTAPQGRWRVVVSSDSPYYPGGPSRQDVTFRIVCDDECVGTLETEGGTIRTVHWDGDELMVELPEEETGAARCFGADQEPGPGSATMTVRRTDEFVLDASEPDEEGRPTRLEGSYDEDIGIGEQSRECGFPHSFTGRWSWSLRSLDSTPVEGEA